MPATAAVLAISLRDHDPLMRQTSGSALAAGLLGGIATGIEDVMPPLEGLESGIAAGAVQGYYGGRIDLGAQRLLEIWGSTPSLYVIIILFAILGRSFWLLVFVSILFGWPDASSKVQRPAGAAERHGRFRPEVILAQGSSSGGPNGPAPARRGRCRRRW